MSTTSPDNAVSLNAAQFASQINSSCMSTLADTDTPDHKSSLAIDEESLPAQQHELFDRMVQDSLAQEMHSISSGQGCGAYGTLKITGDISRYTKAKCLQPGVETPMIVRFSAPEAEQAALGNGRSLKEFALKFYTPQGNWDFIGNNLPVVTLRDADKEYSKTNSDPSADSWDFWSLNPESLHQLTLLMTDRGVPLSPMHMNGYGGHTFSLINHHNERFWVKFHFKTLQGHKAVTDFKMANVNVQQSYEELLFNAIANNQYPGWSFQIQIMTEQEAHNIDFDPFDATRTWPLSLFPLQEVGILELNRNPENYFAEIESVVFSSSNTVPGISNTNVNDHEKRAEFNRDFYGKKDDYFQQSRDFFIRILKDEEKQRLFNTIAEAWQSVPNEICERQLSLFKHIHPDYEKGVRQVWNTLKCSIP